MTHYLDPHQRPPENFRTVYKKYQKIKLKDLDQDSDILDLSRDLPAHHREKMRVIKQWNGEQLTAIYRSFASQDIQLDGFGPELLFPAYEHEDLPGLHIIPSLIPPSVQITLLSRLLHRDLSSPSHLTNIHTHYHITYPPSSTSFFTIPPNSPTPITTPIDPSIHKPLTISQLLNKKMRWATLGGQYDWTQKRYPDTEPPAFPPDIKHLLEGIFTETRAEAAIVNLYSPGDTLSLHRDVAETSSTGLISVSLGCDAVFIIGTGGSEDEDEGGKGSGEDKTETRGRILTLRLRSGDIVYMSGESRFAWHGVPQIVPETCPEYLKDWPGGASDEQGEYSSWKGWMENKRINLNVRQMWD